MVYPLVHEIRVDIVAHIGESLPLHLLVCHTFSLREGTPTPLHSSLTRYPDTPLTYDQLIAPDSTYTIIR
jgi:hypothetical protein